MALKTALMTLLLGLSLPVQAAQDTSTDYQYDPNGNLTQATSPLDSPGNPVITDYLYDSLGQLATITQPNPAAGGQRPNTFLYRDGQGQLTRVEDPRLLATDYSVDGLGNVTALASPDSGVTSSTYDEAGNLKAQTDARGKATSYSYDAQNRLARATYASGTPTVFTYDGGPANTVAANIGKLTAISDESGSTSYSYDAAGRPSAKTQRLTGTQTSWNKTVSYAYGTTGAAKGKLSSVTYPSGNRINYTYDAAGRIASVSLNPTNANGVGPNTAVTTSLLNTIKYTPTGQFYSGVWGNHSAAAPNTITHADDLDGRIKAVRLGTPSQGGLVRTLAYDAASRVTAMAHTGTGTGAFAPANFDQGFSYDNLGRLTAYTSATGSQSYSYDASGNRTSAGSDSYSIDLISNRLLQTAATAPNRSYDAVGNLASDGSTAYTYSDRGRLKSAQQGAAITNYAYNGLGQRVKKIGSSDGSITQYVYDEQGHLLGEYDFMGRPLQETVYLGDMPVAVLTQTPGTNGTGIVQVDNTATASVTAVGLWPASTTIPGYVGTNYQTHAASAGTDSVSWKLALPAIGKYSIQARWTVNATNRASDATYTVDVTGTEGNSSRALDQRANNNTWVSLGMKNVTATGITTVKLATSSLGLVAADAVRAVPIVAVVTNINYVFTDHLGTPRVITRASDNQMVWRWDNADPFGAAQPNANPAGLGVFTYNPRFPGQLYDAETGLYYNYHRNYAPQIGSYTQSDPIGLGGGINTYAYVSGNPVNYTDPLGLQPNQSCVNGCTLVGGVIGGGVGYLGGGALGGAGGTLALPGGGTLAGAVSGAEVGGAAGAAAGSTAGRGVGEKLCPDDDDKCDPPVGTKCYEGPDTTHPHGGLTTHYHIYQMFKFDGKCQWKYLGGKVGKGVLEIPPSDMAACSTYSGFQGR